jgi:replicative DNA helicase
METTNDYSREQYLAKPLPSNPDAERVIIGGIILDNNLILQCIEANLSPDDFYSPLHRKIFKAMLDLFGRSERIDPILIGTELKKIDSLESIGGVATITNFTHGLPHFSGVSDYVKIVKDSSKTRSLIKKCNAITSMALSEEHPGEDILEFAEKEIFELRENKLDNSVINLYDGMVASAKKVREFSASANNALLGLSTGFKDWNQITSGLVETDLILVAGRPSQGKTSLALQLVLNATDDDPNAVCAIFSLEMSKEQVSARMLCQTAKVDSFRYRQNFLIKDEWERIGQAIAQNKSKKIIIDDTPGISPFTLRAKARRLFAEQKKLDLIVVDYIQLMSGSKRSESRQQEVSQISRELKAIAKELKVPIVALSQLSRAPEARNPPKPIMSDLRESGSLEQDADIVAFIYREEYYKPTDENTGLAEILISKNRNGPTGTIKLAFLREFTRFENYYQE